ncbi:response regulator transcription factor, partial [Flavobacterium filum]
MIRIAIVDDNPFLQKTIQDKLKFFSDVEVRFKAINGLDIIEKVEKNHHLDLILMDIEMPKMNGIEATSLLKSKFPQIKIIMLTVFDNDENIFKAIKAGADGYFLKEVNPQELYDGIVETLAGGAGMTPSIATRTLKLLREPLVFDDSISKEEISLTNREIEVLEQLSKGLTYNA